MKNKKGVSPLTVLLIGFTFALAAVIMTWGNGFIREEYTITTQECTNETITREGYLEPLENQWVSYDELMNNITKNMTLAIKRSELIALDRHLLLIKVKELLSSKMEMYDYCEDQDTKFNVIHENDTDIIYDVKYHFDCFNPTTIEQICENKTLDEIEIENDIVTCEISSKYCGERIKSPAKIIFNSTNISEMMIEGCKPSCHKIEDTKIQAKDITKEFLNENCECTKVSIDNKNYVSKGDTAWDIGNVDWNKIINYNKAIKCIKYQCGDYIISRR